MNHGRDEQLYSVLRPEFPSEVLQSAELDMCHGCSFVYPILTLESTITAFTSILGL